MFLMYILYWIISTKDWEMSMYKSVKSKIAHFNIDNKKVLLVCTNKIRATYIVGIKDYYVIEIADL
jgi:hypothetical protein